MFRNESCPSGATRFPRRLNVQPAVPNGAIDHVGNWHTAVNANTAVCPVSVKSDAAQCAHPWGAHAILDLLIARVHVESGEPVRMAIVERAEMRSSSVGALRYVADRA
jgi:hypothetical protein